MTPVELLSRQIEVALAALAIRVRRELDGIGRVLRGGL